MNKLSLAEIAEITNAETNSTAEIFFERVTTDSRKISGGARRRRNDYQQNYFVGRGGKLKQSSYREDGR